VMCGVGRCVELRQARGWLTPPLPSIAEGRASARSSVEAASFLRRGAPPAGPKSCVELCGGVQSPHGGARAGWRGGVVSALCSGYNKIIKPNVIYHFSSETYKAAKRTEHRADRAAVAVACLLLVERASTSEHKHKVEGGVCGERERSFGRRGRVRIR
jgi:hypothetical protein